MQVDKTPRRGPGRPQTSLDGKGNQKFACRVPPEVAAWLAQKPRYWLSQLVQREYEKEQAAH